LGKGKEGEGKCIKGNESARVVLGGNLGFRYEIKHHIFNKPIKYLGINLRRRKSHALVATYLILG